MKLKDFKNLARHGKIEMTLRYAHKRQEDLAGAVNLLPPLREDPLRMRAAGCERFNRTKTPTTRLPPVARGPETTQAPTVSGLVRRLSLVVFSEGDGARTRNHRIDSPPVSFRKRRRRSHLRRRQAVIRPETGPTNQTQWLGHRRN